MKFLKHMTKKHLPWILLVLVLIVGAVYYFAKIVPAGSSVSLIPMGIINPVQLDSDGHPILVGGKPIPCTPDTCRIVPIAPGLNVGGNSLLPTDFFGTTNSTDLTFKSNNIARLSLTSDGKIKFLPTISTNSYLYVYDRKGGHDGWLEPLCGCDSGTSKEGCNVTDFPTDLATGTSVGLFCYDQWVDKYGVQFSDRYDRQDVTPTSVLTADLVSGRIGIGTENPGYTLDVPGNARIGSLNAENISLTDGKIRITNGVAGKVLTSDANGLASWVAPAGGGGGGMTNPMTDIGDIIVGGSGGVPTRLNSIDAISGQVLTLVGDHKTPTWVTPAGGGSSPFVVNSGVIKQNSTNYALSLGSNTIAESPFESSFPNTAFGDSTTASGRVSTAFGHGTIASGAYSTAFGDGTNASGDYSTAFGGSTMASGFYSSTFGFNTTARSYGSLVIGRYNLVSGTFLLWENTEPVFVIGNGTSSSGLSNALTVFKNGQLRLGTGNDVYDVSGASLVIGGTIKIVDGLQGAGKVLTSDANGLASWVAPTGGGGGSLIGLTIDNITTLGVGAGTAGSTGSNNTFIGKNSGYYNTTGNNNTATGSSALYTNTDGLQNTANGADALRLNTTGNNNTATGSSALYSNTTGSENVANGQGALGANIIGGNNVALGRSAGANSVGDNNVFLGYKAGFNEVNSNKLYIANSDGFAPLIYGDFSTGRIGIGTTTPGTALNISHLENLPVVGVRGVVCIDDAGNLFVDDDGVVDCL